MSPGSQNNAGSVRAFVRAMEAGRRLCDQGWRWGSLSIGPGRIIELRVAGERVRLRFGIFLATDRFLGLVDVCPRRGRFRDHEAVFLAVGAGLKTLGYKSLRGMKDPDSIVFRKRLNDVRKLEGEWKALLGLEGRLPASSGGQAIPSEEPVIRGKRAVLPSSLFPKLAAWLRRREGLGWRARAAGWATKRISHRDGYRWTVFFGAHWVGLPDKLDLSVTIWPQKKFGVADRNRLRKSGFYRRVQRHWNEQGFEGRWQPWPGGGPGLWAPLSKVGLVTAMAVSEGLRLAGESPVS